jgi:hypothetical protein
VAALAACLVIGIGLSQLSPASDTRAEVSRPTGGHFHGVPESTPAPLIDQEYAPAGFVLPSALADRYWAATRPPSHQLEDSASRLGFPQVLSPERLSSPDTVEVTRAALESYRDLIDRYRATEVNVERAYRDTAEYLAKGQWTMGDLEAWRAAVRSPEPPAMANRTDSLVRTLDALYDLLRREAGHYAMTDGVFRFRDRHAAATFGALRERLAGLLEPPPDSTTPAPLALLLTALRVAPLPKPAAR